MSKREAAKNEATRSGGRRAGLGGSALALLALVWTGAPGGLRADTIVLQSGEVVEGAIIDATRNTVIVRPAIGGMRPMSRGDIKEVRIELAGGRGQSISGELLGWADGVYQVRSGGQVVRISEGTVLSREPGEIATGAPPRDPAPRPGEPQTVRRAAAPATSAPGETTAAPATSAPRETTAARPASARGQTAARAPQGDDRGPSAGDVQSAAADEEQSPATDEKRAVAAVEDSIPAAGQAQSQATNDEQSAAAKEDKSPATDEKRDLAAVEDSIPAAGQAQSPASDDEQSAAAKEGKNPGTGEEQSPAAEEQQRPAGGEERSVAEGKDRRPAADEGQRLAALGQDQGPAPGEKQNLAVKASVAPAPPGADDMVFKIELSRPAEQTVVLIYGTVEGTAKAGEDFEPQQGMVTLAPGSKSAEVRVPLIEGSTAQGERRFELFLAADPKVAEILDKRIVATIQGGD